MADRRHPGHGRVERHRRGARPPAGAATDATWSSRRGALDRLEALAHELEAAHGIQVHVIASRPEPSRRSDRRWCRSSRRRGLVEVDWLVNNAGFGTGGRFDELPVERELEEIRLNVSAPVELTGRLLPGMVARGARRGDERRVDGRLRPDAVLGDLRERRRRSC